MIGSVRAELLRMSRWPAVWVLVGAWLVLNLTFGYLFNYLAYTGDGGSAFADDQGTPASALMAEMLPNNAPVVLVQGMPMFGGALVMILGAMVVGSGYGWGTWKTVFTTGPRRRTALMGTYAALTAVVLTLVAATFVLDLSASIVIASVESQAWAWPTVADAASGLGSGLLITGMWAAGGVLLGTIARGPALAVGLGLVWALVVENLLRGVANLLGPVEAVTDWLPGTAAGSLAGALAESGSVGVEGTPGVLTTLGGGAATITLGAYLVAFLIAATLLTTRRDLT